MLAVLFSITLWLACGVPPATFVARRMYADRYSGTTDTVVAAGGIIACGPVSLVCGILGALVYCALPLMVPKLREDRAVAAAKAAAATEVERRKATDLLHRELGLPAVQWRS